MDAILQATIQVLLASGKERLTTTRVAARAGVSVGTLYQYFPNKSSLLQAVLRRHFDEVAAALGRVCEEQRGQSLRSMACALVSAFLQAKMRDPRTSVALYAISSDVDGNKLAQEASVGMHRGMSALLQTAADGPLKNPDLVVTVVQGAMAGVSRRLLETDAPERHMAPVQEELAAMVTAYLEGCSRERPRALASVHAQLSA